LPVSYIPYGQKKRKCAVSLKALSPFEGRRENPGISGEGLSTP